MAVPEYVDLSMFIVIRTSFVDALELPPAEVCWEARVMDDLGAESLDLLDVVFRIERAFGVQIARGGISAYTDVLGAPGVVRGALTESGRDRLRELMPEVPPAEIREGLKTVEIPGLFRVGTFYHIVSALLDERRQVA